MDTFTWGIIGPGNIATEFAHDLDLIKTARHRVGAVLSHSLDKAAAFAQQEEATQYFDDMDAFTNEARIDAVYIATPHPLHHAAALHCLQHKIPVLCEKPLAMNSDQVKEIVDAAAKHQTFLMEGMWTRFLPSMLQVLSLIEANAIGKVISVKADMSYKAPYDPGSRYFNPELGGGSLLDLGIYPVFLTQLLLGKPATIQATARLSDKQVDEACAAVLGYNNGAYAFIESSLVTQTALTATIHGETGRIHIGTPWNEQPSGIIVTSYDGKEKHYPCEWEGHGLQYETEEVYHCIRQGKLYSDKYSHQFSLDVMSTLDAIRQQTGIIYPEDGAW